MTCEVNHWLPFLSTWDDVERLGPYALSYWVPDDARAAVWEALRDGTIDVFSSDHAPHTREEKEIGWTQMWSAHTGTPGIQYFYPLALDAVSEGKLTLQRVVDLMATKPGRALRPRPAARARSCPGWTPTSWSRTSTHPGRSPTTTCCRRSAGRATTGGRSAPGSSAPSSAGERCTPTGRSSAPPGYGRLAVRTATRGVNRMKFGLLLPHFGEEASREKLLEGSKRAEELGFDSVWVRDHLVFEPHGEMEKPNRTFYDALTTLDGDRCGHRTDRARHRVADPIPAPAGHGADGGHDHAAGRATADPRLRRRHLRPRVRGDRLG